MPVIDTPIISMIKCGYNSRKLRHCVSPSFKIRQLLVWKDGKVTEGFFYSMPDYDVINLSIKYGKEYLTYKPRRTAYLPYL